MFDGPGRIASGERAHDDPQRSSLADMDVMKKTWWFPWYEDGPEKSEAPVENGG